MTHPVFSKLTFKCVFLYQIGRSGGSTFQHLTANTSILPPSTMDFDYLFKSDAIRLKCIGQGTCGTIFDIGVRVNDEDGLKYPKASKFMSAGYVFKKGSSAKALCTDFNLTNCANTAVEEARCWENMVDLDQKVRYCIPRVPVAYAFRKARDDGMSMEEDLRFPLGWQGAGTRFAETKIPSVPFTVQRDLVEAYSAEDPGVEGDHCLIRVYLGERRSPRTRRAPCLRNFELRLDQIQEIQSTDSSGPLLRLKGAIEVDASVLAKEMATGLAIIHWQAQIDGMDIEFVLGGQALGDIKPHFGPNHTEYGPRDRPAERLRRWRDIHLWMLDFDKANKISLTKKDVDRKLIPAFVGNDPYYPLPGKCRDENLWREFKQSYLSLSEHILERRMKEDAIAGDVMELPKYFISGVERQVSENDRWDPEAQIVFEE